jgi:hypothetical protein
MATHKGRIDREKGASRWTEIRWRPSLAAPGGKPHGAGTAAVLRRVYPGTRREGAVAWRLALAALVVTRPGVLRAWDTIARAGRGRDRADLRHAEPALGVGSIGGLTSGASTQESY